jgi:hypothetical protein
MVTLDSVCILTNVIIINPIRSNIIFWITIFQKIIEAIIAQTNIRLYHDQHFRIFFPFRHINIWGMDQQVNYKTMGSNNLITNKEKAIGSKWNNKKMEILEGKD